MKKSLLTIAWAAVLAAVPALLSAQLQDVARFNLQHPCESFMNAQSFFVYSHDNVLYNYRSVTLLDAAGDLQQALINPTGSSVAALYKGKTYFDIASARDANDILYVAATNAKACPASPSPSRPPTPPTPANCWSATPWVKSSSTAPPTTACSRP